MSIAYIDLRSAKQIWSTLEIFVGLNCVDYNLVANCGVLLYSN